MNLIWGPDIVLQTREMIDEIIKSFEKRIEKHDWIDKKTRKGILEKVRIDFC